MCVRVRKEQIMVDKKEETALTVYWASAGIDRCKLED